MFANGTTFNIRPLARVLEHNTNNLTQLEIFLNGHSAAHMEQMSGRLTCLKFEKNTRADYYIVTDGQDQHFE